MFECGKEINEFLTNLEQEFFWSIDETTLNKLNLESLIIVIARLGIALKSNYTIDCWVTDVRDLSVWREELTTELAKSQFSAL